MFGKAATMYAIAYWSNFSKPVIVSVDRFSKGRGGGGYVYVGSSSPMSDQQNVGNFSVLREGGSMIDGRRRADEMSTMCSWGRRGGGRGRFG